MKWSYQDDAKNSRSGRMICEKCNRKIVSGEYRYYLNDKLDAYLSEHRTCSLSDLEWHKRDSIKEDKKRKDAEFMVEGREFCEKYGLDFNEVWDMYE